MEGFEWIAEMKDGMTSPAKHMAESLEGLRKEMLSNEQELLRLQKLQQSYKLGGDKEGAKGIGVGIGNLRLQQRGLAIESKHLSGELTEMSKAAEGSSGALGGLGEALVPEIAAGELVAEAIKKIGEAAVEAGEYVVELGIEGTKFALEASEFKENMTEAFGVFLDTAGAGERTYEAVRGISDALHAPIEKTAGLAQELLQSGLENEKELKSAVVAVTELARVGNEAAGERLKDVIERGIAQGKFTVSAKQLKGTGVDLPGLIKQIAERTGESTALVAAKLKEGGVDITAGVDALTHAITEGKIGELARNKLTIGDVAVDFKNTLRDLFSGVEVKPLLSELRQLVGAFGVNTAAGQTLKSAIGGTFNWIIDKAAKLTRGVKLIALQVELFAITGYNKLHPVIRLFDRLHIGTYLWRGVLLGMAGVLAGITIAVGPLVAAFAALGALITAAAAGVGAIATGVGAAASWVGGKLGIGKPEVLPAPAHAEGGVVGKPAPGEAFASVGPGEMILPKDFDVGRGQAPAAQAGGDTRVSVDVGGIHVHGGEGQGADLDEMLEDKITDLFERVANEMGG